MIKSRTLLRKLAKYFPKKLSIRHHDFVGTMIGPIPQEINSIVLCLDLDELLLEKIAEIRPDLIITHHPFFYGSKTRILKSDPHKLQVYEELKKLRIGVISMHTNFDEGNRGMNDALVALLKLNNVYAPSEEPMMRIGYLSDEMNINDFVKYAKEALDVEYGLLLHYGDDIIKKVGIVGGGGSYLYKIAQNEGCDIYISGDAPHHIRRSIVLDKCNYLDVPHEVERVFMSQMSKIIKEIDENITINILNHEKAPKVI